MDPKLIQAMWLIPTSIVAIVLFIGVWEWLIDMVIQLLGLLYDRITKHN